MSSPCGDGRHYPPPITIPPPADRWKIAMGLELVPTSGEVTARCGLQRGESQSCLAVVCLFLIFQVLSNGAGAFKTCDRSRAFGQNRRVRIHLLNTLYSNHSSGNLLRFFQKSHDDSPFQMDECALQAAETVYFDGVRTSACR